MSAPSSKDPSIAPVLDRRSFLKGSSLAAAGTALASAGLTAGEAEATPAGSVPKIAGGNDDWKAGWLAT